MFISTLDIFKIGIGPSSSHTMGPMVAANTFRQHVVHYVQEHPQCGSLRFQCTLKGSLAYTGKGHATDTAILLGAHGYTPKAMMGLETAEIVTRLQQERHIDDSKQVMFDWEQDIHFDMGPALPQHPNGMIFSLLDHRNLPVLTATFFSIGGGFLNTPEEIDSLTAPIRTSDTSHHPYPFDSAREMLEMAERSGKTIAEMKSANELLHHSTSELDTCLDQIWQTMRHAVVNGLNGSGKLPGPLGLERRAGKLYRQLLQANTPPAVTDWLSVYAMAVSEENGAGHIVVTAPTNGAAGVIPALMFFAVEHLGATDMDVRTFLLTAAAIGGIIKHRSSISGAEVGCQGEVGSASAMAAAGFCAIRGGSPAQVEHAAEMALEHHLGLTCDPVAGLVQIPCIERNGFGAVKAYTAASLALLGDGKHYMMLDNCIAAMKQIGLEMSEKFKETSLGGLATSYTEC